MSELIFKYGSMGSGKSMQLIALATQYKRRNQRILVLKPSIDTRFSNNNIVSRNNLKLQVNFLITKECDLLNFENIFDFQCIFVDECQFLSAKNVEQLRKIAFKVQVYCFGLLTDFKSNLFVGSKSLIELADSIEEIKSACQYCNSSAKYNLRHVNQKPIFSGEVILLGAEDVYYPTCAKCYFEMKYNSETESER